MLRQKYYVKTSNRSYFKRIVSKHIEFKIQTVFQHWLFKLSREIYVHWGLVYHIFKIEKVLCTVITEGRKKFFKKNIDGARNMRVDMLCA